MSCGKEVVDPAQNSLSALGARILLLDDDPFQLLMQACRLANAGFDGVKILDNGAAALEALRDDPLAFDIIVCDLNMPGMDGIEFLRCLGSGVYSGHVILLSGEGPRIMHTVQSLLAGTRLAILGVVEKQAAGYELPRLLYQWVPGDPIRMSKAQPDFKAADIVPAARNRQWVLHYQPKVDLRSGRLAGMEALVRWKHPVQGLVLPDRFIGVAENSGAIDMLTDWVLREAISQLAIWQREGLQITMAVNISMENLRDGDFTSKLDRIASEARISPQDLTLEITESRVIERIHLPLDRLVRLRLHRFGLSIDDFGTGHSSLSQLRDVPFSELKIDRGFVSGARHDPVIRPILESSIRLAKELGMSSVAEGVETEQDWHLLRELGCGLAQGYFIGRPMPSAHVAAWLAGWLNRRAGLIAK
jgi:EAL domain-containing protein (putative c-di-GMP-specific phosphodiesterase class I)/CheY-like chemotaxis protein